MARTVVFDVQDSHELHEFTDYLGHKHGVEAVEVTRNGNFTQLKFTYDSNLLNLGQFGRLAEQYGVDVSDNYQFLVLPFTGLRSADDAAVVERSTDKIPGVLDTVVNFAARLFFVAYDTSKVSIEEVVQTASKLGIYIVDHEGIEEELKTIHLTEGHDHPKHEHDHDEHKHDEHEHKHEHDHHAHSEGKHDHHEGEHEHHHAEAPAFLPEWVRDNWAWVQIGLAGALMLLGILASQMGATVVGIAFFIGSYYFAGAEVAKHALPALLRGKFDTDVLMVLAAIGAAILGAWAEGAFLLFLFAVGHAGEDMALDKARNAIGELKRLMPDTAEVKHGDHYHTTHVEDVKVSDVVLVRPGDRIPVDGVVLVGRSTVDQSTITGESVPVTKVVGDKVFTGTVNHTESLEIGVSSVSDNSTLARVVKLVQEAQSQRSKTQQWVAKFTARFVPAVLVITVLVMFVPPIFGWLTFAESFYRALTLLVAASPCALAIGTPAAVLSAIAHAARNGVLIKGGIYLEELGKLDAIAFDKTGTLTAGGFSVQDVKPIGVSSTDLLKVVGAVESLSNHPLAKAIVAHCAKSGIKLSAATSIENLPGLGVRGWVDGKEVLIGSLKMFQTLGVLGKDSAGIQSTVSALQKAGKTVMVVSVSGAVIGLLALEDALRPNTAELIKALKGLGVRHAIMLTGDNAEVAKIVADRVGIQEYRASLLPEHKLDIIRKLDENYGGVAMIGDGVNDAPALAAATVGVAMGGIGSGVALETADVVLMDDSIDKIPFAMGLARESQKIIKQNLVIALGVILVLIASILFVQIPIGIAVTFHEGSTVLVALNALRLLAYKQR